MNCSRCGYLINDYQGLYSCPLCGTAGVGNGRSGTGADTIAPWETPSASQKPLRALAVTLRNSFVRPFRFFSAVSASASPLTPALFYGLVTGSAGVLAAMLWNTLLPFSPASLIPDSPFVDNYNDASSPARLIATPLLIVMQILLSALFVHAMLFITRSRKRKFSLTFKTVCYAEGAMLLQIVPFIGALLSIAAWFYLVVYGTHAAHGISKKRALIALLLPMVVLAALAAAIVFLGAIAYAVLNGSQQDLFSIFKTR